MSGAQALGSSPPLGPESLWASSQASAAAPPPTQAATGIDALGPHHAGQGRLKPWPAYGFATLVTAATLGLRLALAAPLGGQPTLVMFTLPIMLSAYLGGLPAGLLATGLSYLAASHYVLPAIYSSRVSAAGLYWQQFFLVLAGVVVSLLSEGLHRARHRAHAAAREHRQAEERVQRSQQRLRDLIDGLGPSIFVGLMTPEGILIEANRPALVAAGLTAEDVLGKPFAETYWWTHSPEVQAQLREAIGRAAGGEPSRYDVRLRAGDHFIDADFSLQVLRDETGRVAFLVPSASVITERKQSEIALQRSEREQRYLVGQLETERERLVAAHALAKVGSAELDELSRRTALRERILSTTLSSIRDFAYIFDRAGRFLFVNQPLLDLWGITLEAAVGKNFVELAYPAELAEQLQRQIQAVFETKKSVTDETPYTSSAGLDGYYEYILSPAFGVDGMVEFVVGTTRDITQRKRAEAALRTSVEEFDALAEAMPQMVWITRPDGWTIWLNRQWMVYTGLALEDSLGQGWLEAFHPEDRQRAWEAWQHARATIGTYSVECRLRRADGVFRWWLIRGVPVADAAGVLMKWFGTCTDIHDLKLAELAISQSEERFATVFQSNLIALAITEMASGRFIDVNTLAGEFFGYTRDEMIGHTISELGLWTDPDERVRRVAEIKANGSTSRGELSFRRKSGEIRHGLVSLEAMTLSGIPEPLVVSGIVDITERKQLESQLLQSQKMEAVGRLAGGVAHDFNNSLGVILGYTELLMREAGDGQRSKLEQILKATQRASSLTRQLLAFSRKQIVDPKVLDLNTLVSDLEKMLGRLIGEDIDLAIVPGADLGQVKADPGQVEQVVLNLCVNARDAMPDGGLLRIETSNVELAGSRADGREPMPAGRYVMLAVSDTGCGIAENLRSKIFEPFFTTKEEGKGTGLGLAMVYGTVKQAGGDVSVESEVGRGSTFKIYLPRIDEPASRDEVPEAAVPMRGTETILLVEDEEPLRAIAREILEEHGYHVIEAGSASEAMKAASWQSGPIHLLLTDVVMPGMNGRVLAEALVDARPELKVLYMSGYTDDVIAHSGVLESGTLLLEKPFTALALLVRVRAALGERGVGENV